MRSRKAYAVVNAANEGQALRRFEAVRHLVQGLPDHDQFAAEPHPKRYAYFRRMFKDGYFEGDRSRY